ncbi:flavin reductase [Micromonospora sp. WMMD1120]|uniref:flavin reductase n=1 Tax=Micromonospora sp. WMMD1120 TaxID=3016106 RepID=UPI002417EEB3|nr:flavin reductase [Micromonospora sp. WMMD1120]MDG4809679.1 flavin reductase [Micromonospora sp. WMMD1120]
MSRQRHSPVRPFWFCACCVRPWPCADAKAELVADYSEEPKLLGVDMADCLTEAGRDLAELYWTAPDPVEMYGRFLGWIKEALAVSRHRREGHFNWF